MQAGETPVIEALEGVTVKVNGKFVAFPEIVLMRVAVIEPTTASV